MDQKITVIKCVTDGWQNEEFHQRSWIYKKESNGEGELKN